MNPTDSALREGVKRGEPAALASVYDEYSPLIFRYLYRRVGNARLAEDLTGQVFVKLLEAVERDTLWNKSFRGWLYRIAHNVLIDHFRKHGNQKLVELDESLVSDEEGLEATITSRLQLERVQQALGQLTEEQAQVIVLRFGEGLSNQEVAQIMGKREGAIKGLQHRAVKALRRLLVEREDS
jgi:RNA polymerase sigma-70 factor (ECF subfamily)